MLGNESLRVFPFREVIFYAKCPRISQNFPRSKPNGMTPTANAGAFKTSSPNRFPTAPTNASEKSARAVYRALRIRGYGRIDLRVTPAGEIVVLEANPNPNLDRDDEFAQSAIKAGVSFPRLVQRIVKLALASQH